MDNYLFNARAPFAMNNESEVFKSHGQWVRCINKDHLLYCMVSVVNGTAMSVALGHTPQQDER